MGNHMILLFCFTADYVCTYRKPYSHYHGSHGVLNCMRSSSFTYSALHLKGIITYIEGNRFFNSSNTDSSLLLDHYISYFIPLLTKYINYENTRPTDSGVLKRWTLPHTAESSLVQLSVWHWPLLQTEAQNILYRIVGPAKLMTYYTFLPHVMQT